MRTAKKMALAMAGLLLFVIGVLLACDRYVSYSTRGFIYDRMEALPERPVALVLGTSKYYGGSINQFYENRVKAAAAMFQAGKVKAVVASGDNATRSYNEPRMLRRDLIAQGVPADHVTMDFAGFRTLDSVVRAREVFRLDSFIVVSQRFQVERALYIAHARHIDAIGFVADVPHDFDRRWRTRVREVFARFRAVLDVNLLQTAPRFLGPAVEVKGVDDSRMGDARDGENRSGEVVEVADKIPDAR